jgi:hypothetical protein
MLNISWQRKIEHCITELKSKLASEALYVHMKIIYLDIERPWMGSLPPLTMGICHVLSSRRMDRRGETSVIFWAWLTDIPHRVFDTTVIRVHSPLAYVSFAYGISIGCSRHSRLSHWRCWPWRCFELNCCSALKSWMAWSADVQAFSWEIFPVLPIDD